MVSTLFDPDSHGVAASMPQLNLDILFEIVKQVQRFDVQTLNGLALVCSTANHAIRAILFAHVRWPHESRHDPQSGLHFFPKALWPYFKSFHLDWPDHWPDASPPLWGTKDIWRGYHPTHLLKLESALPLMPFISIFQITAPFSPPMSLLYCLVQCPNIKDLRITDTPLYAHIKDLRTTDTPLYSQMLPTLPAWWALERMTLVPVAEALRVGEGPFDKRFHDVAYYTRGYRKRHWNDARFAGLRYLLQLGSPKSLRYVQISGKFCTLGDFLEVDVWPALETLVLTGSAPKRTAVTSLAGVVKRMPKLIDLRLLLAKPTQPGEEAFSMTSGYSVVSEDPPPTGFSQVKHLAVSNAVKMDNILHYTTSLERLALIAIINQPRIPIAMLRSELDKVLSDLEVGGSGKTLKQIRVMTENELDVALFVNLGRACPALEEVEIEVCGYPTGYEDVGFEWTDYGDVFSTYAHLRSLRIGIPFETSPEPDEPPSFPPSHHPIRPSSSSSSPSTNNLNTINTPLYLSAHHAHPIDTTDRFAFATYLASRVPTLQRIGFEYRRRTAVVRYEDRWVDWGVERRPAGVYAYPEGDSDSDVSLWEMPETWYVFPEVWKEEVLAQETPK